MQSEQNLIETELVIDSTTQVHLKETAVWGKFLGIVGFIYSLLIAVGAVFAGSTMARLSGNYSKGNEGVMAGGFVAIFYLALAGVVFFMSMFLFRFSKKSLLALQSNDQSVLTDAFRNLKIYFRFSGIITVIALILTTLGLIGVLMASAFSRG